MFNNEQLSRVYAAAYAASYRNNGTGTWAADAAKHACEHYKEYIRKNMSASGDVYNGVNENE